MTEPAAPQPPSQHALAGAARYVAFFETMTPAALDDGLDAVASPDIHFVDPFNDVTGVAALRRILRAMYGDTRDPRFVVTHRAFDGDVCFLRWRFTAGVPALRADLEIVGMTELRFAADGRVCEHVDHWDAAGQMYERVPGLGWVLRRLRRRLGHG